MKFSAFLVFISQLQILNAYEGQVLKVEEVIVTAQKREQNIQNIPISVTALGETQLLRLGVTNLERLGEGFIPSLKIDPNGNTPSSLTVAIRGDGPSDVVQPLRETPVAIYLDGIYLGRAQGLNIELADLQRIEVLRGPQGTLFGRNSTSGAINMVTNKPTGKFGIEQTFGAGNFDAIRSLTRINLPSIAGIRTKLNYIHSQRDGWVENRAPDQADYNEFEKKGGDIAFRWDVSEKATFDYRYDKSEIEATQQYSQNYAGNPGQISVLEKNRETKTRFPLPLKPTISELSGHSFVASWIVSDFLTVRSLTAYREIEEDGSLNYAGVLSSGGIILEEDIEQEQYSQELQLVGSHENFEWVAGLFYFKEDADFDLHLLFSLTPTNQVLIPPVSSPGAPPTFVIGDSESMAVYGQGTFTIGNKIDLTFGARYTADEKSANRNGVQSRAIDSDNIDGIVSFSYQLTEEAFSYVKWSTAYKAGGYNVRSLTFNPYEEETNQTYEIGLKSNWLNRQLRLNLAAFYSEFKDKQFDFADPVFTIAVDTLNAIKEVELSGLEIELTAMPTLNLALGLNYTYLDGDMPKQPHPQFDGISQSFEFIQTPTHAASFIIDYERAINSLGTLNAHLDVTSTSRYAHSTVPISSQDSYTLLNARLELRHFAQIYEGKLSASLWARNLTDEEYADLRYNISATNSTIQAFGIPRTFGVDITYKY